MPAAVTAQVDYPKTGSGSARVLVELQVEVDGTVTGVKVLDGLEPFVSSVLEAANRWRFSPAKRDGVVVSARIRFLVRFEQPTTSIAAQVAQKSAPVSGDTRAPAPAANGRGAKQPVARAPDLADAPSALEVTVVGQRPEVATISMGRADVEQLPGAFGDPFRAIESLPGVVPMVSGMPFFFIRGAPPGNQGYFLDGVRVPLLYHMAMGPGIVHPALVDRVDLYAGGYPAQFGRYAGAIVAAQSRDPVPEYHAQGSIRLVDSGAYVTAPFLRGSAALSGRYSYTAAIVSLLAPEVKIDYWDYQLKTVQYLTDKDTVGVFAFGSMDLVQDKSSDAPGSLVGTEFHRVDLRYQRTFDSKTRLRTGFTLGFDKTLAGEAIAVRDRLMAARAVLERAFSTAVSLRVGADAGLDAYDVIIPVPEGGDAKLIASLPKRKDTVAGVWSDLAWNPTKNLLVVPGVRFDHYSSGGATRAAVEPRVTAVYSLRKNLRLIHAFGVAHQPPSFVVPIPGFQISGLSDGLQRSLQSSAKVEMDLPHQLSAAGTVFQNAFFNLTDQLSLMAMNNDVDLAQRSRGRTFGLELSLRRSFSQRIGGFLAYTLSKSWRTLNGIRVPASFDRRHVFQAAIAFDLGRNWRASSRLMFYSGIPSNFTTSDSLGNSATDVSVNPQHLPRTPAYWRTDIRLQKRWPVGAKGAYWAFTFEALNATLNKEVIYQECSVQRCRPERVGPIAIPSIGLEAAY